MTIGNQPFSSPPSHSPNNNNSNYPMMNMSNMNNISGSGSPNSQQQQESPTVKTPHLIIHTNRTTGIGSKYNETPLEPTLVDQLGVNVPANLTELKGQLEEQIHHQYTQLYSIFAPPEKPPQFKFTTVNFYATLNEPEILELKASAVKERTRLRKAIRGINQDFVGLIKEFVRIGFSNVQRWFQRPFVAGLTFLLVLSLLSAVASVLVDLMTFKLVQARVKTMNLATTWWGKYLVWIVYGLVFALLSESCVRYISPFIIGSGMADMKTMISGIVMERVLSVRTMIGKFLGIATTMSSSLTVGRVGPYIHITACMGHQLLKLPMFKRLRQNDFTRTNLLCAAISVATAATFGTPVGAVLFAIELSTTYFLVSNTWKVFVASLFGSGFFFLARHVGVFPHSLEGVSFALYPTNFPPFPYHWWEYSAFAFLGLFLGLLGGVFLKLVVQIIKIRNRFKILREARYMAVFVVCLVIACIDWWISLANMSSGALFHRLFGNVPFDLSKGSVIQQLAILFLFKYFATLFSLSLPIPNGVTVQSWIMGACISRIIGELLKTYVDPGVNPAGYAVVGCCAMSVSITKSLSMIVIVLESTGQTQYTIPCFLASILAKAIASTFTTSIYEHMIKLRNMPCLILTNPYIGQNILAVNIMKSDVAFISTEDSMKQIDELLERTNHLSYPVVDNRTNRMVIGEASRVHIEKMLDQYREIAPSLMDNNNHGVVNIVRNYSNEPDSNPFDDIELQNISMSDNSSAHAEHKPAEESVTISNDNAIIDAEVNSILHNRTSNNNNNTQPVQGYVGDILMAPSMIDANYQKESIEIRNRISKALSESRNQVSELTPEMESKLHDDGEVTIHAAKYITMNRRGRCDMVLEVDPAPFCINELTSLNKIQYLFSMLGLGSTWVTSQSRLKGVLTKKDLINASKELESYLED